MKCTNPTLVCVVSKVHLAAIVGEVGKDDTEVDKASEHTGTETTD